jgi:hypothetical protein
MNPKQAILPPPYPGYTNNTFYTHNDDWAGYEGWLITNYFPLRSGTVLNQFRSLGLYPSSAAPSFSQFGGRIPAGYQLYMTNNAGAATVYFTTNGADPRVYGSGAVSSQALTYTNGIPLAIPASTAKMRPRPSVDPSPWTLPQGDSRFSTAAALRSSDSRCVPRRSPVQARRVAPSFQRGFGLSMSVGRWLLCAIDHHDAGCVGTRHSQAAGRLDEVHANDFRRRSHCSARRAHDRQRNE